MALDQRLVVHPGDEIAHVGREMLRPFVRRRIEGVGGTAIRARRAAETHVDASRRQRFEDAEDLRHFERRIVRQHDARAADPDALGRGGDGRHHDLGRGADDGRMVVMLRHPEALVAQRLAMLGERHGVADRLVLRPAGDGDRLVQDGKAEGTRHGMEMGPATYSGKVAIM